MLTECPVRSLTHDVRHALAVFDRCHVRHTSEKGVAFERVSLPGPGTVLEQDAWMMDCLGFINRHLSSALTEHQRRNARAAK